MGAKGRKSLVEAWAPFLPTFLDQQAPANQGPQPSTAQPAAYPHGPVQYSGHHGQVGEIRNKYHKNNLVERKGAYQT